MQLGVVSGLIALLSSGEGIAEVEIQVDGPRSCSRAAELRTRVERALGRTLEQLGDVSCRVHVVRDGGSYAARVELSSTGRARTLQRSFSAKTCPKLMDTLELAVVLAVGADGDVGAGGGTSLGDARLASAAFVSEQTALPALSSAPPRERPGASHSMSSGATLVTDVALLAKEAPIAKAPLSFAMPAAVATSAERTPAPAWTRSDATSAQPVSTSAPSSDVTHVEPEAESVHDRAALWRAYGGLVFDSGALPGPALGAQLGGSFGSELELRVLGTYLLPRQASVAAAAGGDEAHGMDFTLATGALLGCKPRLMRPGRVDLGVCAGGELGGLWSGEDELTRSRLTWTLWSALRADVGARWEVAPSWLAIDVRLGLSVQLSRPRFTLDAAGDGLTEVYRPSAIGGRLSAAATFALDGAR